MQAVNTANSTSGGYTTLKGAVVAANTVQANVGGNLSVESLQDTSTYTSRQSSAGGSISVGGGKVSGGISGCKSNIDSNYQSVNLTSGIQAGDGGFQVSVNNNTDLKGGVIASTQAAVDNNRNTFTTGGTLSTSDIQNSASYTGEAVGISASIGKSVDNKGNTSYLPGVGVGIGGDKGSASSTTTAGISGIAGNTAVRTGDAQTGIAPIFDAGKVQREIDAQVTITQAFTKEAPKAIATFAANQIKELRITLSQTQDAATRTNLLSEIDKWSEGGIYRVALHTLGGAFGGGVNGALGAATVASAANWMNDFQASMAQSLEKAGLSPDTAQAFAQGVTTLTAAGIGAAVGGSQGAATAVTVDVNNRQLHQDEYDRARKYRDQAAKWLSQLEGRTVTPQEAEARMVRQMERNVDYATAKQDGFRTDQAIVAFLGKELPKQDQYYYDTNYNSQYIAANASAYNAAQAQSNSGLTPQEITDTNNQAGAPIAKVGAIVLGGYVLAPAAAGLATEVVAFLKNPWVYCSISPVACIAAVDAGAAASAAVPISGVNLPANTVSTVANEVKTGLSEVKVGAKGADDVLNAPRVIPYQPSGSVILQGNAPVCGPACASMTISDGTGTSVSLQTVIGSFPNGIRPTGVSTAELSNVITNAGLPNTVSTAMLPGELNKALQNGQTVIVQVPAGNGYHFMIVDKVEIFNGASYYMTRDPAQGPRGVLSSLLDNLMATGVNAITIGKK